MNQKRKSVAFTLEFRFSAMPTVIEVHYGLVIPMLKDDDALWLAAFDVISFQADGLWVDQLTKNGD